MEKYKPLRPLIVAFVVLVLVITAVVWAKSHHTSEQSSAQTPPSSTPSDASFPTVSPSHLPTEDPDTEGYFEDYGKPAKDCATINGFGLDAFNARVIAYETLRLNEDSAKDMELLATQSYINSHPGDPRLKRFDNQHLSIVTDQSTIHCTVLTDTSVSVQIQLVITDTTQDSGSETTTEPYDIGSHATVWILQNGTWKIEKELL